MSAFTPWSNLRGAKRGGAVKQSRLGQLVAYSSIRQLLALGSFARRFASPPPSPAENKFQIVLLSNWVKLADK